MINRKRLWTCAMRRGWFLLIKQSTVFILQIWVQVVWWINIRIWLFNIINFPQPIGLIERSRTLPNIINHPFMALWEVYPCTWMWNPAWWIINLATSDCFFRFYWPMCFCKLAEVALYSFSFPTWTSMASNQH